MALLAFLGVPPPKQRKPATAKQNTLSNSERISAIFGKQYATKK